MPFRIFLGISAAFFAAALAPALAAAVFGFATGGGASAGSLAIIVFLFALAHALVLGVPAFLIGRMLHRIGFFSCLLIGFAIGALPFAFLALSSMYSLTDASVAGQPTVVDHVPTLQGWLGYLQSVALFGAIGAFCGFVFWSVLKTTGLLPLANKGEATLSRSRPVIAAAVVAGLTALVFTLPTITMDRSCHNWARDGRSSIGPSLTIDLEIPPTQWPALAALAERFAKSHQLSLRDDSLSQGGFTQAFAMSLCKEPGTEIAFSGQRWIGNNPPPMMQTRGAEVAFYISRDDGRWKSIARDLIGTLQTQWPGKVRFDLGGGKTMTTPPGLDASTPRK